MIRVGTTEGRFRMIMPDLIRGVMTEVPGVRVDARMADAVALREMLVSGELDVAFSGLTPSMPESLRAELILDEKLFFVISDNLLAEYGIPERETCFDSRREADLSLFAEVPVCRSLPHLHCMQILDELLERGQIQMNCVHVSPHYDLHQQLAIRDYAACFCLGMYLPHLMALNENSENKLRVFGIRGLVKTNPVYLIRRSLTGKPVGEPGEQNGGLLMFERLLKEECARIEILQERITTC